MATIKSFTSLEQSRKLANILPLESADIYWSTTLNTPVPYLATKLEHQMYKEGANLIPCWSLAALLKILAKTASKIDDDGSANLSSFMGQWSVNMFDCPVEATDNYDNPVDACVAMVEKLNKLNLL